MPLSILYKDEDLVVIDKPPGLLVHRTDLDRRIQQVAMQRLRNQLGQPVFVVHRLDRGTSGVLLFALHREAARFLINEFQQRRVKKEYTALVRGYTDDCGEIDTPLYEKLDPICDAQADPNKAPQTALTEYKTLDRIELPCAVGRYATARYSLVRINPHTGRRHQIRRHFNYLSHPVIGDTTHGDHRHNRFFREQLGIDRMLLMSNRLEIRHPSSLDTLTVELPTEDLCNFSHLQEIAERHKRVG
ncbi:MAG: hypothetical protein CMJ78_07750 [Planctomycetaceae bacterium]|nr:hypothetical protein [Planctomycetaceae bacterium]